MNKFFLFLLGTTVLFMSSSFYIFNDNALASLHEAEEAEVEETKGRAEIAKRLKVAQVMSEQEGWKRFELNFDGNDTDSFGSLKTNEIKAYKLNLPEGFTYRIVATCGKCLDVDLELYLELEIDEIDEPDPYLIDHELDFVPILQMTPTREHTKLILLIRMYACTVSSCPYGFEIYSKPALEEEAGEDEDVARRLSRQEETSFISAFEVESIKKQIAKYPRGEWAIDLDFPPVTGEIENNERKKHSLTLKGGTSYVIVGSGGCADCGDREIDLDLLLSGPTSWQSNEDLSINPWAKVSVSIPEGESLEFLLVVKMHKCPVSKCHYNFVVYSKPHSYDPALTMQLDVPEPHRSLLLQTLVGILSVFNTNPHPYEPYSLGGWDLAHRQIYQYVFELPKGEYEYTIVGTCTNCEDIDLSLRDSQGVLIDKDDLPDNVPILDFSNNVGDNSFILSVSMYQCPNKERCFFGLGIFKRRVPSSPRAPNNSDRSFREL